MATSNDPQSGLQPYVMTVLDTVVGFALMKMLTVDEVEDAYSHYDVEPMVDMKSKTTHKQAELKVYSVNPIFMRRSTLFVQEMLRISGKVAIHLRIDGDATAAGLRGVMHEFSPVNPRTRVRSIHAGGGSNKDLEHQYALFVATTRLLGTPYTQWNTRVVVVGASDTSLGLIQELLLSRETRTVNVCLVSPEGLASHTAPPPFANRSLAFDK